MKIHSMVFNDGAEDGWRIPKFSLNDHINLFVGESGSGKTRLLNIFFNIGRHVAQDRGISASKWEIVFSHNDIKYIWHYESVHSEKNESVVIVERIAQAAEDGSETIIAERDHDTILFEGVKAPKLSKQSTLLYLLREEESIKNCFGAFNNIMRRNFFGGDLSKSIAFESIPISLITAIKDKRDVTDIWRAEPSLHVALYLLREYFKDLYDTVVTTFKQVFPFIESIDFTKDNQYVNIRNYGEFVVMIAKERGINKPAPLNELSSGMQKVLLIITDLVICPQNAIYMIDEYENSLGVNAIDFLPPFLLTHAENVQVIMTSHHPSLINAIPVKNWLVFNRKGVVINIKSGADLEEKYGRSKQQKFIQLMNDPYYSDGVL